MEQTTTTTDLSSLPLSSSSQSSNVFGQDIEKAKEANAKRAARFGIEFREPPKELFMTEQEKKRYKNPKGGFALGVDMMDEAAEEKRRLRAQKFGIPLDSTPLKCLVDEEGEGIFSEGQIARLEPHPSAELRKDTLHLWGTDRMTTEEVFEYFDTLAPTHVEWLNDSACNVIFADSFAAQRALQIFSRSLTEEEKKELEKNEKKKQKDTKENTKEEDDDIEVDEKEEPVKEERKETAWRRAKQYKGLSLLLRQATIEDRRPTQIPRGNRLWTQPKRHQEVQAAQPRREKRKREMKDNETQNRAKRFAKVFSAIERTPNQKKSSRDPSNKAEERAPETAEKATKQEEEEEEEEIVVDEVDIEVLNG